MRWRSSITTPTAAALLLLAAACGADDPSPSSARPSDADTVTTPPDGRSETVPPADGDSGFAASGGFQVHYEVHGDGRPLVLVHGWAASIWTNWDLTGWIDALTPVRQVIALDIRGHGDSDKPHDQAAYGYAAMADDVLAVMDHLGLERADYIGYSLGAFTGVRLMGHHPDRFSSFVLMGVGDETAETLALAPRIAAALRARTPDEIDDPEGRDYRALVDLDSRNDREALALAALEMWPQGYPLALGDPGLGDIDVPVLVLNGADDPYAATDDALAAAVAGAELVEVPGADHLGVLTEPTFKDEALRFLQDL